MVTLVPFLRLLFNEQFFLPPHTRCSEQFTILSVAAIGCNPNHTFLGVRIIGYNGTCFWVDMLRIAVLHSLGVWESSVKNIALRYVIIEKENTVAYHTLFAATPHLDGKKKGLCACCLTWKRFWEEEGGRKSEISHLYTAKSFIEREEIFISLPYLVMLLLHRQDFCVVL